MKGGGDREKMCDNGLRSAVADVCLLRQNWFWSYINIRVSGVRGVLCNRARHTGRLEVEVSQV